MYRGYVKLWRKTRDNPHFKDPEKLAMWIWILLLAQHTSNKEMLGGKKITVNPGQFTTGRKQLSSLVGVSESKCERVLTCFENEQQIEQQKTNRNRLISITNWKDYQQNEQQNKRQMNNKRTTSEQQVNTPEECKRMKKNEKKLNTLSGLPDFEAPIIYLNKKANRNYDPKNTANRDLVKARYNEGRTLKDFQLVIDNKVIDWLNDADMMKYLRPSTLFNKTKFENYINEPKKKSWMDKEEKLK